MILYQRYKDTWCVMNLTVNVNELFEFGTAKRNAAWLIVK